MMNSLLRGIGSGFGRAFGRIIAFAVIAFIAYLLITHFDIDIKSIIGRFSFI